MKIISFAANNFRGIHGGLENNRITFEGCNTIFIFGQNNVGKSTFLLAYDFLYSNKTASENDFYNKSEKNSIEMELEVEIDKIDVEYIKKVQEKKIASFSQYLSEGNVLKIKRIISANLEKNKLKIDSPRDLTLNPKTNNWDETAFGTIGLSTVFQYLLPTPIIIKAMPTEEEVENIINDILASKAKRKLDAGEFSELTDAQEKIKDLQNKMYNPVSIDDYKKQVNLHFSKLFPDLSIDFLDKDKVKWTEDKFGKKFEVHFQKKNVDGSLNGEVPTSYNTIGHGAVRSAIFSLLLMRDIAEEMEKVQGRKEYLILFEEPELFLHPSLMRELRELIYLVGEEDYPYQILCASHSPQMIDLSKDNSSLVRMVKNSDGTKLFQLTINDLLEAKEARTKDDLRNELYEILRFNPHICESFYADEIILIEGPTEEIIIRGILQKENPPKEFFIVNCNSVNNIPFYQKVYSKFFIKHHVICDGDGQKIESKDERDNPVFTTGIQKSISNLFKGKPSAGILRVHEPTFEPAHQDIGIPETLKYPTFYNSSDGKPFNANRYWKEILSQNYHVPEILSVPVIKNVRDILKYKW